MKTLKLLLVILVSNLSLAVNAQWNNTGDSKTTGSLTVGSDINNSQSEFKILGPNLPITEDSKRDIIFDFKNAGKSIIRSFRGGAWDTHLEFYTTNEEWAPIQKRMSLSYQGVKLLGETTIGEHKGEQYISNEEGTRLYLRGTYWNNDDVYMSRFNRSANCTDLRMNVGFSTEDKLAVGYTQWESHGPVWKQFFTVQGDGKVGIGVENPRNALDVKGTICADKVEIKVINWSDFVFAKDYKLPTLESVEEHIAEYGHLPEIPSEKEVIENGVDIIQMQAKLLQKIEELTLYTIQQQKHIETLKNEVKELKSNR